MRLLLGRRQNSFVLKTVTRFIEWIFTILYMIFNFEEIKRQELSRQEET